MAGTLKFQRMNLIGVLFLVLSLNASFLYAQQSRLVIEGITAPEKVAPGSSFQVRVTGSDTLGIREFIILFNGQQYRVPAGGALWKTISQEVMTAGTGAGGTGLKRLEAVAIGIDGVRGQPASASVLVETALTALEPTTMTAKQFVARNAEWERLGLTPMERYQRDSTYEEAQVPFQALEKWYKQHPTEQMEKKVWWGDVMLLHGRQPFNWKTNCPVSVRRSGLTPDGEVLNCWLNLHPEIKEKLIWEKVDYTDGVPQVTPLSFPSWTADMKSNLYHNFYDYWNWLEKGMSYPLFGYPDPPVNQAPPYARSITILNEQQAWVMYLFSVAHSLALEVGGFVPWSVLGYNPVDLGVLFSSKSIVPWLSLDTVDGEVLGYHPEGVTHAPPDKVFRFFAEKDIIRANHYWTIARLLRWGRDNMLHSGCNTDIELGAAEFNYAHWQYYGDPPVSRMLQGTPNYCNHYQMGNWTDGCGGTSYFFKSILRSLNIPVYALGHGDEAIHLGGHSVPFFPTIGSTLSHGDDVYDMKGNLPTLDPNDIPPQEVFISSITFIGWFVLTDFPEADHNLERRPAEVAIEYLPNWMMDLYCSAPLAGFEDPCTHPVIVAFDYFYSCQGLLNMNLLERMEVKNQKLNYCHN